MSQERAMTEAKIAHEFSKLESENAEHKKVRREVAEDMANTAARMRAMAIEEGIKLVDDPAVRPAYFRWIEDWRAKLLEGIEKEDAGT